MATKKKVDHKLGWHFLPSDMKLEYGDGRKVKVGATLSIPKTEVPDTCTVGMHASDKPSQAAIHRKGLVLCRVLVTGDLDVAPNKFCGRNRTVIWAKELKEKDLKEIFKAIDPNYSSDNWSHDVYGLSRAAGSDSKFDTAIKAWAKKNGWTSDAIPFGSNVIKLEFQKGILDEETLKKFLSPRVVRTIAEIRKDLEATFELDGGSNGNLVTLEDMLDNMAGTYRSGVCVVDDYAENGDSGYVLKLKRSR